MEDNRTFEELVSSMTDTIKQGVQDTAANMIDDAVPFFTRFPTVSTVDLAYNIALEMGIIKSGDDAPDWLRAVAGLAFFLAAHRYTVKHAATVEVTYTTEVWATTPETAIERYRDGLYDTEKATHVLGRIVDAGEPFVVPNKEE